MRNIKQSQTEKYVKERQKRKWWQRGVSLLAAVTMFCTTYAMILPAVTWERSLVCEVPEHSHKESCYEIVTVPAEKELVCFDEEHVHTDECYKTVVEEHEEKVLVCRLEEHEHTADCFDAPPAKDDGYYCGQIEHSHTDEQYCYFSDGSLRCTISEHQHTLACQSNPEADVENEADWCSAFANITLTGNWADDVISIARTQLGYTESAANYEVEEDGVTKKGYTRFGDWYGNDYGDWCAMFCSFCLHYAGVDSSTMPFAQSCSRWVGELSARNLFHAATDGYKPKSGDLVFFDLNADMLADHVGLVYQVSGSGITTIEGNWGDRVCTVERSFADGVIMGYGELPRTMAEQDNIVRSADDAADSNTISLTAFGPNGITVLLTGSPESLPYPTDELQLKVTEVNDKRIDALIDNSEYAESENTALDITLWHDTEEAQLCGDITLSFVGIEGVGDDNAQVLHLDPETATIEEMASTSEKNVVTLDTDHFSIYVVSVPVHTFTFYVDGAEAAKQIVKDGEELMAPSTPQKENFKFRGWSRSSTGGDPHFTDFGVQTVETTEETNLYADFAPIYYVFFMQEDHELDDGAAYKVLATKEGVTGTTINTKDVYYRVGDGIELIGWTLTKGGTTPIEDPFTIGNEDVTLYPVTEHGHWITYETQTGDSYVKPAYFPQSKRTTVPAQPTRAGYTFRHWSTTPNGSAFTFGQTLASSITLYAVWQPVQVNYTIIHWIENANYYDDDDADAGIMPPDVVDSEEYSFGYSETKRGYSGSQTAATANTTTYDTTHWTAQPITQSEVDGHGNTIVNVYYKRTVKTIYFQIATHVKGDADALDGGKQIYDVNGKPFTIKAKWGATVSKLWPDQRSENFNFVIKGSDITRSNNRVKLYVNNAGASSETNIRNAQKRYQGQSKDLFPTGSMWCIWNDPVSNWGWYESVIGAMPDEDAEYYYLGEQHKFEINYDFMVEPIPGETNDGTWKQFNGQWYKMKVHDLMWSDHPDWWTTQEVEYEGFTYINNIKENLAMFYKGIWNGFGTSSADAVNAGYIYWTFDGTPQKVIRSLSDVSNGVETAVFLYSRNQYDVHFFSEGTEIGLDIGKDIYFEQDISDISYTPTRNGYTFAGWYSNGVFAGDPYSFEGKTMPAKDITLYAKWVPLTVTVRYYDDIAENEPELRSEQTYDIGNSVDPERVPDVKKEDARFIYWMTKEDGEYVQFNMNTHLENDTDLYPLFVDNGKLMITYDLNDDMAIDICGAAVVGNPPTDIHEGGYSYGSYAAVELLPEDLELPGGLVFLRWNTAADDSGTDYYPEEKVFMDDDYTLYAIWGPNPNYNTTCLTYHSNFGDDREEETYQIDPIPVNDQIMIQDVMFENPGFKFLGWNTKPDGTGNAWESNDKVRLDNIEPFPNDLYAMWERQTSKLTIIKTVSGELSETLFNILKQNLNFPVTVGGASDTAVINNWEYNTNDKTWTGSWSKEYPVGEDTAAGTVTETGADVAGFARTTKYDGESKTYASFELQADADVTVEVDNAYIQQTSNISVTKTFEGLSKDQINALKDTFAITVTDTNNAEKTITLTLRDEGVVEKHPLLSKEYSYTWVIHGFGPGTYKIRETGMEIPGWEITTTVNGSETTTGEAIIQIGLENTNEIDETAKQISRKGDASVNLLSEIEPEHVLTIEFYADDSAGKPFDTQKIVDGGKSIKPDISKVEVKGEFTGYADKDGHAFESFDTPMTVSENGTLKLYAQWDETSFVVYHDQFGRVILREAYHEGYKFRKDYPVFDTGLQAQNNAWNTKADGSGTSYADGAELTALDEDLNVYAELVDGNFVRFDSDGGTPIRYQFIESSGRATRPADPTRAGYRFDGWFTDEGCTQAYNFNTVVAAETLLYAKWTPATANYTVRIWLEKESHDNESGPTAADYTYWKSFTKTGISGSNVSFTNADLNNAVVREAIYSHTSPDDFQLYFYDDNFNSYAKTLTLNSIEEVNGSGGIAGDGKTVLNVYFRRMVFNATLTDAGVISGDANHPYSYTFPIRIGEPLNDALDRAGIVLNEDFFETISKTMFDVNIRWVTSVDNGYSANAEVLLINHPFNPKSMYADFVEEDRAPFYDNSNLVVSLTNSNKGDVLFRRIRHSETLESALEGREKDYSAFDYDNFDVTDEQYRRRNKELDNFSISARSGFELYFLQIINPDGNYATEAYNGTAINGRPHPYGGKEAYVPLPYTLEFFEVRKSYVIDFETYANSRKADAHTVVYGDAINKLDGQITYTDENGEHEFVVGETEYTDDKLVVWVFQGWYDNDEFFGTPFDFEATSKTMPADNMHFYAKWVKKPIEVTYDPEGGTMEGMEQGEEKTDTQASGKIPKYYEPIAPEGMIFLCWTLDGQYYDFTDPMSTSQTLKAVYTSSAKHKVIYKAGEGSGIVPIDSEKYAPNTNARVLTPDESLLAPQNMHFVCWTDGENYYEIGATVPIENSDVTLTAVYAGNYSSLLLVKVFKGLSDEQLDVLAESYSITVTGREASRTFTLSSGEKNINTETGEIRYTWNLYEFGKGTYTVTEAGTDVEGYTLTDYGFGETVVPDWGVIRVVNEYLNDTEIHNKYLAKVTITKTVDGDDTSGIFPMKLTASVDLKQYEDLIVTNNPESSEPYITDIAFAKSDESTDVYDILTFKTTHGGSITIPVMTETELTVTETAHNGYTVTVNTVIGTEVNSIHADSVTIKATDASLIAFTNKPGAILPETGGIGTKIIYALGAILVIGSIMTGFILRRRRERRKK